MTTQEAQTILLVEDEPVVRQAVEFHLRRAGYEVRSAATATQAWNLLEGIDAVVLDWMLPDEPGTSWLKRLRNNPIFRSLPVLLLTARASEIDRVEGLDAGADDYLTKPFSAAELAARIRALLRRSGLNLNPELLRGTHTLGNLRINMDTGIAILQGKDLVLTRREFDLLIFLAAHPGRVYARQELLDKVWGEDFMGGERTVDQHITQLRACLQDDPHNPIYLETVRGKGYRMRVQSDNKTIENKTDVQA